MAAAQCQCVLSVLAPRHNDWRYGTKNMAQTTSPSYMYKAFLLRCTETLILLIIMVYSSCFFPNFFVLLAAVYISDVILGIGVPIEGLSVPLPICVPNPTRMIPYEMWLALRCVTMLHIYEVWYIIRRLPFWQQLFNTWYLFKVLLPFFGSSSVLL